MRLAHEAAGAACKEHRAEGAGAQVGFGEGHHAGGSAEELEPFGNAGFADKEDVGGTAGTGEGDQARDGVEYPGCGAILLIDVRQDGGGDAKARLVQGEALSYVEVSAVRKLGDMEGGEGKDAVHDKVEGESETGDLNTPEGPHGFAAVESETRGGCEVMEELQIEHVHAKPLGWIARVCNSHGENWTVVIGHIAIVRRALRKGLLWLTMMGRRVDATRY